MPSDHSPQVCLVVDSIRRDVFWRGLRTVRSEGATVYRGKLADELFALVCLFHLQSSHLVGLDKMPPLHETMIAELAGLRADGHANDLSDKWMLKWKKVCKIGLGNKVGSSCFKTNKYTYLKRDMLCIVQVFERAVSAPQGRSKIVVASKR